MAACGSSSSKSSSAGSATSAVIVELGGDGVLLASRPICSRAMRYEHEVAEWLEGTPA